MFIHLAAKKETGLPSFLPASPELTTITFGI